ncbi:glutamine-hydrolyzing GMP synthase [Candidatus Peregrinibacteria bacterium CG10_big_fil_rev_8_21_14_0_10_36_19]|nr:MAG: glutamine-hydrolyzing GMP synthase [Candidatus Peregrinibacteria bacterium CG10_big_fil_rev_8_21_14_0_10_36_19]
MDKIVVLDFGGQYAHLIANRVRGFGVYTEIKEPEVSAEELKEYKGIIMSGGPSSVNSDEGLSCDPAIFDLGIPVLGICYGHQVIAKQLGGIIEKGKIREYGRAFVDFKKSEGLLKGLKEKEEVWMNHFDQVVKLPEGFELIGETEDCPITAMADENRKFYGVQFHPEVTHTPCGSQLLENFVNITGAKREWNIDDYIESAIKDIQTQVGDKKVFLMISGGVDSTVAFLLLDKALGQDRVFGLFVDTGFMRLNERNEVEQALKELGVVNLHVYDASNEYFDALKGVYEPEAKRKIIGDLFLDIQAKVSDDLSLNPDEWILGQGTIYPDTIETGGTKHADKIKTHHNRVERVQKLMEEGKVIEPLSQLYKDEVRMVGKKLGLNDKMTFRHPFPGPGLAVRCLCVEGEDTFDGIENVENEINKIVAADGLKAKVLPLKSVGVQGDERTYRHPVCLYGNKVSWDRLDSLATRLTNQFDEVNRVIYCLNTNEINDLCIVKGDLNKERTLTIQEADKIVMDYLTEANIHREIWQFPTVLIPVNLNSRNGESVVLRPVCSSEAMTANFYRMKEELLTPLVERLVSTNKLSGIFYDITNKPPGTIEWE